MGIAQGDKDFFLNIEGGECEGGFESDEIQCSVFGSCNVLQDFLLMATFAEKRLSISLLVRPFLLYSAVSPHSSSQVLYMKEGKKEMCVALRSMCSQFGASHRGSYGGGCISGGRSSLIFSDPYGDYRPSS